MIDKSDSIDWLQRTLLFRGLSLEQLRPVAQIAQIQKFQKGSTIFIQDSEATGFFVVKTGRVKVFKMAANGKEQILHLLGVRDYFAEVPALDGKCFPASAVALESTELIFFPRIAFLNLLHQYPAISINLLMSLAAHSRKLTQLVEELSFKDVPQRLASYLLCLSDRSNSNDVINLDITKTQLAATLGTIPATLSRAFYRLSNEGLIAMNGSQIELLDRERLQSSLDLGELNDR